MAVRRPVLPGWRIRPAPGVWMADRRRAPPSATAAGTQAPTCALRGPERAGGRSGGGEGLRGAGCVVRKSARRKPEVELPGQVACSESKRVIDCGLVISLVAVGGREIGRAH